MKRIVIHQTLHGYSDGHRLLQGSIKFNDELARLVLRMSDLSGSNVVPGFEEYVTGYPIEPMNVYALAKTWYASEMPRPGCVWTHTLFIADSAMTDIPDLQALTKLFVRPPLPTSIGSVKPVEGYSEPIEFEAAVSESVHSIKDDFPPIQIADLIETMYREGKNNILIGAPSSRAHEAAIFRVWSQQWPRLRRVFTFCTGALSSRGLGGKPFDVQSAPASLVREIISSTTAKQSQEMNLLSKTNQEQPAWFVRAVEDASTLAGGLFRKLLWNFADVPDKAQYIKFANLIDVFLNSAERSPGDMIRMVAEQFPSKETGYALKSAFFGKGGTVTGFKPFDEGEILAGLASTSDHAAFDSAALLLKSRGRDLCGTDAVSARHTISKIFRAPLNPLGEDILAGMVEAINPAIARHVTAEQPQFLPTLFRAKPELGASAELWVAAGDRKRELFEALVTQPKLADRLVESVSAALLESDSDYLLKRALDTWGQPAVFGVFIWLMNKNGQLSERVSAALTFHVESVVKWVLANQDAPQRVILNAAHIIAPFTYQFRQFDANIWLNTYRALAKQGDRREADYFAAMILALGFQNALPEGLLLVEECFERVHKVAWDDAMPDDIWYIIDPIVPHLWWHRDWDKCERLRRGLIEAFVKFHWPVIKLADCVKSDVFLERVIESAKHVEGGKDLVSQKF